MARRRNRRLKRPHLARSCTNIPSQPVLLYSSSFTPRVFPLPPWSFFPTFSSLPASFPFSLYRSLSNLSRWSHAFPLSLSCSLWLSPLLYRSYRKGPVPRSICFGRAEATNRSRSRSTICWWKESTCRYPMPASMASHSLVTNEMFPVDRWLNFNRCTIQLPLFRDETTRLLYRWRWRTALCRFCSIGTIL